MDGQWRFEIDDSKIKLRYEATAENGRETIPNYTTLGNLIDAPELFAAYPDMRNMDVVFQDLNGGAYGAYNRQFDSIDLSRKLKSSRYDLLDTLTHEIQHAVQNRESFTRGTTPTYWNRQLENGFDGRTANQKKRSAQLAEKYNQLKSTDPQLMKAVEELEAMTPTVPRGEVDWDTLEQLTPDPPEWERYDAKREGILEKYGDRAYEYMDTVSRARSIQGEGGRTPTQLYYATAGEIEARDTTARRQMSAEERKNTPPNLGDADTVFEDGSDVSAYVDVDADGNPVTVIKTAKALFDGAPKSAYANIAKKLIMSEYAGKTLPLGENDLARITKASGGEYGYPSNTLPTNSKEYNAKMRASAELHNLLENSTYDHWAADKKNHAEATLGFDYYKTVFIVDGKVFEGLINIANSENGRVFYDITNIKEASDYTRKYAAPLARSSSTFGNLSMANIRQTEGNSQEKSSGKASVEVENREPRYTVLDGKDAAGKESALADAYVSRRHLTRRIRLEHLQLPVRAESVCQRT